MTSAFTDQPLSGKVAFLAGASSGINLGIARRFASAGAAVTLLSRSSERIQAAARELTNSGHAAIGVAADVRDYAAIERAFELARQQFGEIDIVISGAAGNFIAPALGMSANAFKAVVDIDLLGTFNVLRASFHHLRRPGASLISITAPQGVTPTMYQAHACSAKAGINMLTQCLAMEWGPAGVRVNAISPGPIADTEGVTRLVPAGQEATLKSRLPLRDYGTTSDVADVALFLSTPHARYITGAIIDCDGGAKLGDASADAVPMIKTPAARAPASGDTTR
jgi:NAD(P)-dependent dehydrogenase (short-subunit alcohol dehydrogenase family)